MKKPRCGYEHSDDYYTEGHTCDRVVGHKGDHSCLIEWETRPEDICKTEGRIEEWKPFTKEMWRHYSMIGYGLDRDDPPTEISVCSRCKIPEFKGGARNATLADILTREPICAWTGIAQIVAN